MEQSHNSSSNNSQQNRWLIESFASRAALLGFVYLCVAITYQQGYLSALGIEFGLFAIAKSLPVFENFLIAAYAFIIWGFLVETSESTYDQVFSFFKPKSWRETKVWEYRFLALSFVGVIYLGLQFLYITRGEWFLPGFISTQAKYFNRVFFLNMVLPTWDYLSWTVTISAVFLLMMLFFISNQIYRQYRASGLKQLFRKQRYFMELHINAVTPAWVILSFIFLLVMVPGWLGHLTANLTIKKVQEEKIQQVKHIELTDVDSFCGEKFQSFQQNKKVWDDPGKDFSIHLLGHFGEYEIFAKIEEQTKGYNICLVHSGSIKTIVFP